MTKFSLRSKILLSVFALTAMSASAADKTPGSPDLFSFANGGRIIDAPDFPEISSMSGGPLNLIDDSTNTGWEGEAGEISFIIELAEVTELHRISFDTGPLNVDSKSPKDFVVEVSETSATKGFTEVLSGTLKMAKIGQSFSFKPQERPTAQWVRLTLLNNYGDDNSAINGFHGFGKQLTQDATMPDLTGKYDGASGWGRVNITDAEDGVSGCYEFAQGEFKGAVDGRVLKLDIVHRFDGTRLSGLFQMMPGAKLVGLVRNNDVGTFGSADYYSAEKASGKPNGC
jgi:Sad1 / UNC-like C-terminal